MADERRAKNSYTPTFIGDSYQPITPTDAPKAFIPPKGGTGARTIELKAVPIADNQQPTNKKQSF